MAQLIKMSIRLLNFLFKFLCETYILKICYIELHFVRSWITKNRRFMLCFKLVLGSWDHVTSLFPQLVPEVLISNILPAWNSNGKKKYVKLSITVTNLGISWNYLLVFGNFSSIHLGNPLQNLTKKNFLNRFPMCKLEKLQSNRIYF